MVVQAEAYWQACTLSKQRSASASCISWAMVMLVLLALCSKVMTSKSPPLLWLWQAAATFFAPDLAALSYYKLVIWAGAGSMQFPL